MKFLFKNLAAAMTATPTLVKGFLRHGKSRSTKKRMILVARRSTLYGIFNW